MTYGESSGHLREALGGLLREHRIQQRLGGTGGHNVPETTTVEEREVLGRQIRRYRECVLMWCLEAVWATDPRFASEATIARRHGPAEGLRHRLAETLAASTAGLAPAEELVAEQRFATVESWRHAARAATLGEHDFTAGVGYGRLSRAEGMTVLKDAADIVRGLVVLDRRYEGVPGWEHLKGPGRLDHAAEACVVHAGHDDPDYTVDRRGWQPAPRPMVGPAPPGFAGVSQAQYNLLLRLDEFPDAHSLRVVMDSQRVVARKASLRIGDVEPDLAAKWSTRAETYTKLVRESRDLGGILGKKYAAGQAAVAASRVCDLRADARMDIDQLRQLDQLFARIDERVCAAVEHGVKQRLYFQRVAVPGLDDHEGQLIRVTRQKYIPITWTVQTDLIAIVRNELRPQPVRPSAPKGAGRSRIDFETSINHRPQPRGTIPDAPTL